MSFAEFVNSYIVTALWSSTDGDTDTPLDRNHGPDDIDSDTLEVIRRDCAAFCHECEDMFAGDYSQAGHDFWLTRNGHGAGFWDGEWPEPEASRLTTAAKRFGECWLMVNDDGTIGGM